MSRRVNCNRLVSGELEGIELSICCLSCCRRCVSPHGGHYAGSHRLTKTLARRLFSVDTGDFPEWNGKAYGGGLCSPDLTLYLWAEFKCLHEKVSHTPFATFVSSQREKLRAEVGSDFRDLDTVLRAFLLGDYVSHKTLNNTTLDDVRERWAVLKRVQEMQGVCPLAHPGALFEFCVKNPHGTVGEFQEMKERVQKVFNLEGNRIMRFLTKGERANLIDTPLADVAEEYETTGRAAAIFSCLTHLVRDETARKIMEHPACQLTISRDGDPKGAATKLVQFWMTRDDVEGRTREVVDALVEAGTDVSHAVGALLDTEPRVSPVSSLHQECLGYIHGQECCEVDEVIGVALIRSATTGKREYRIARMLIALTKFEELFVEQGNSLKDSIQEARQYASRILVPILRKNCDWDFEELTKGHWSQMYLSELEQSSFMTLRNLPAQW